MLVFLHGPENTLKTTLLNTIMNMLNPLVQKVEIDSVIRKRPLHQ
jgi:hypothetical protein